MTSSLTLLPLGMSYLRQHNKLPPSSVASSSKCFFHPRFLAGGGVWWCSWVLGLCVSHKAAIQVSLGTVVTLRLNPSKLTHLVVGRTRVLVGSGGEDFSCFLAVACRPCSLSVRSWRHSRSFHQREVRKQEEGCQRRHAVIFATLYSLEANL